MTTTKNSDKEKPTWDDKLPTALPTAATSTAVHCPSLPPRAGPALHNHPALHAGPEVLDGHRVDDHGRHALAVPLLLRGLLKVRKLATRFSEDFPGI